MASMALAPGGADEGELVGTDEEVAVGGDEGEVVGGDGDAAIDDVIVPIGASADSEPLSSTPSEKIISLHLYSSVGGASSAFGFPAPPDSSALLPHSGVSPG